ncbi:hypothetical protein Glove_168g166 [Diversispora epigaea]|uniref:Ion transport domain-containing protein n=1 Tax=Diversispora epigaea TaxID=1348612 RepID=A0A397IPV9_9GLOM|nr:hypothetical protein Glove_168g166 [Diversispora epigaea]
MSKEYHSSSHKENGKDSSGKSITNPTEKESLDFSSFLAISPDGEKIVTFSPETHEFKLYNIDVGDKSPSESISAPNSKVNNEHLCWSIAISNCVDDDKNERFVALSCFDTRVLKSDNKSTNQNGRKDIELGNKYFSKTWVISTKNVNIIYTSSIGGVIRFLDSDDSSLKNKTVIIIVHASGIYKETMNNNIKQRFFSQSSNIKKFELPKQLSTRLSNDDLQNSLEILHKSIIKNHFMVHSFENRKQVIEMYSLITGDLEMLFKRHESSVAPDIIRGSPISAISQNEKILAFCRGTTSITLYFMENGLEIVTKQLEGQRGSYKIVAINFIDDDSKLLIVLEEKDQGSKHHQIFIIWDLFTTFKNSIRQIVYSETLKIDINYGLINSSGKTFAVKDNGDIFSVLDLKNVASIRNPTTPSEKKMTKIDITKDHEIYNIDGERCDTPKLDENYFRVSVYLDYAKRTQLIISQNIIQVWKYRRDRRDRVLEYIWARNKVIDILELIIGEREFVLKVEITSIECSATQKSAMIHWPNNTNVLKEACRALYILREKKKNVKGHEDVNKIKYLIECTQALVRKYVTKYGIFRLTSIRYSIMKYLIKGYQESLIKHILNKKINRKNSNIYIPRLYKWKDDTEISTSDLQHAILCIHKRGSTAVLKYLIDYYADNAKEYNNHGWMCTVSKEIPSLYDENLGELVYHLFKKPGIIEAYTPPLHIDSYDQAKGNNAAMIYSLVVKPRLELKSYNTLWLLKILFPRTETSNNNRKVFIVPFKDFTVCKNPKDHNKNYPQYFWILSTLFQKSLWRNRKAIENTKKMSPFIRVIREEKGYEIYQSPIIMAVLDFKWPAARRYYIQYIIIYISYVISFILTVGAHSSTRIDYLFKVESKTILKISLFVYFYTGWYLIATEIVQLMREGPRRYISIYNNFDLASVLLPLACNILVTLDYHENIILQNSAFNAVLATTALVTWLELLLLSRYLEVPGRFIDIIKSILITVLPFLGVMFIVVLAFGHAMFILLNFSDNFQIPTYKIKDTSNLNLYSNITIYQNVDKSSRLDNYYSHFVSSVEAVFFWTNGRWNQLDQWNSYTVDVMSILGSIILVLIFQNMLIAFMNDAFDKANKKSRIAVYRRRAKIIAEYEATKKLFSSRSGSGYIYYIPDPDLIDTWLKKDEKQISRHMGESEEFDYSYDDNSDDDNDDDNDDNYNDNQGNSSYLKEYRHEGPSSTMDSDSIEPITIEYNGTINKISFIDEEIFLASRKSNCKLSKNVSYNKSSNGDPGPTTNADDKSMQERLDRLEQNVETILKILNSLKNPKEDI